MIHDILHITDCHDDGDLCGNSAANKVRLAYRSSGDRHGLTIGSVEIGSVVKFNTIDLGFKAADQYFTYLHLGGPALTGRKQVFAFNAAPPRQAQGAANNARDLFVLGRFRDGTPFGSTQKGYALSYLKGEIAELHELVDSNNGSQFRSLEVLPEAIVQFVAGTIAPERLRPLDPATIPAPPAEGHVLAIDNFGNVKIQLTEEQRAGLQQALAATPGDGTLPVAIGFGATSLEFAPSDQPVQPLTVAWLKEKMFSATVGDNVLALTSSARLRGPDGTLRPVAQLASICSRPDQALGFAVPPVGAPVFVSLISEGD